MKLPNKWCRFVVPISFYMGASWCGGGMLWLAWHLSSCSHLKSPRNRADRRWPVKCQAEGKKSRGPHDRQHMLSTGIWLVEVYTKQEKDIRHLNIHRYLTVGWRFQLVIFIFIETVVVWIFDLDRFAVFFMPRKAAWLPWWCGSLGSCSAGDVKRKKWLMNFKFGDWSSVSIVWIYGRRNDSR